jgi:DNA polymerase-3 subunit alpha
MNSFTQLHNHSCYSLLDGMTRIEDLIDIAKAQKLTHLSVTDHGNMFGTYNFMKACLENDIRPIPGIEMYFCNDVSVRDKDEKYRHVSLWAKNAEGFQNLKKLLTDAELKYKYKKPRVDMDVLSQYSNGIICGTACIMGVVAGSASPIEDAARLVDIFGTDLFIEIMRVDCTGEAETNKMLMSVADKFNIPIIATNDCHYPYKEDGPLHESLLRINTASNLAFPSHEFYYKSREEMLNTFSDIPFAVDNIGLVLERIEEIPMPKSVPLPEFDITIDPLYEQCKLEGVPPERVHVEFIRSICRYMLGRIPLYDSMSVYEERIDRELDVIDLMDQAEYILLTRRICLFVRSSRGLLDYGRGSCAASLIAFLLGITLVDPIRMKTEQDVDLLFNRFLNVGRCVQYDFDFKDAPIEKWKLASQAT